MKVLLALIVLASYATTAAYSQAISWDGRDVGTSFGSYPEFRIMACTIEYFIYEPYYGQICPIIAKRWYDRTGENDSVTRQFLYCSEPFMGDSIAIVPPEYFPLIPEFSYYECMEGNWSWTLELIDETGVTRASISRDCMEKLHLVINDLQVNLPEEAQVIANRRQSVGTIE